MTVGDVAGVLTAVGMFLNGVATALSFYQSWKNGKTIEQVHLATNSMKDALVASTAKESYAAGIKAGEALSMNINHRRSD